MTESIPFVNSIFEQPWWLDAVAPGHWEVIEIEKEGKIIARLPYVKTKRFGFKLIGIPQYTQTIGYWISETGTKKTKIYARKKDLVSELIDQLPKGYNVDLCLDHSCDYLFPFKWKGYNLHLSYSYRLEDIHDSETVWNGLADNIRGDIKKAQKQLKVYDNCQIDDLIVIQKKTFGRQGRVYHGDEELLRRLDKALLQHNARKLLCAVDTEGRIHSVAYFVFDPKCCYYLMGGSDPALRNSGASSLLVWEGIKFASTVSQTFDFEGSMIEPIERFFRAFGGTPTPYWRVTKLNTILSMGDFLKPKIKKLIGWK